MNDKHLFVPLSGLFHCFDIFSHQNQTDNTDYKGNKASSNKLIFASESFLGITKYFFKLNRL
jgi:hypothetical protein